MNRKKLPRVITPAGGAALADLQAGHPTKLDLVGGPGQVMRGSGTAASVAEVVVPLPEPASPGPSGVPVQRVSRSGRISTARRRARALKIVDWHAG